MCRNYPPFYEVEVNGVCVSKPPKAEPTGAYDWVGMGLILVVATVPIYLAFKLIK